MAHFEVTDTAIKLVATSEEIEKLKEDGDFSLSAEYDFFHEDSYSVGNNSDYFLDTLDSYGHLSEAPCLTTHVGDGEADITIPVAYYEPYQLKSFLQDLIEKGEAVFTKI